MDFYERIVDRSILNTYEYDMDFNSIYLLYYAFYTESQNLRLHKSTFQGKDQPKIHFFKCYFNTENGQVNYSKCDRSTSESCGTSYLF